MLVFRIEDEDGLGPYRSKNHLPFNTSWSTDSRPTPLHDKTWNNLEAINKLIDYWDPNPNILFGFDTIDKLKKWFNKEMMETHLFKHDFNIAVYKAKEAYVSKYQAVFIPRVLLRKVHIKRFLWELENKLA